MSISQRISRLRELGNIGPTELSTLAGASRAFVTHVEQELIKAPSYEKAHGIAEACGVTVEWLFSGTGPAPTEKQVTSAIAAARKSAARKAVA